MQQLIHDIWLFTYHGLPIKFIIAQPVDQVEAHLRQHSYWSAIVTKKSPIVVRVSHRSAVARRLHNPLTTFGAPILYASLSTVTISETIHTLVSGHFTFSILVRSEFWLGLLVACGMTILSILRVVRVLIQDGFSEELIGFAVFLPTGPILALAMFKILSFQLHRHQDDIQIIIETLQGILTLQDKKKSTAT